MKFKEVAEIQNLNYRDRFYFPTDGKKKVWEKLQRGDGLQLYKIQVAEIYGGKVKYINEQTKVVFLRSKDEN